MRLIPYCFATDSAANTIYGYTLGRKDGTTSNTFYNILIKSNPNPRSDLTDLTWTVVSVSPLSRNHILDIYTGNDQTYNCAIDDNGVFSVLSRRYSPSFDIESYEYIPRGLQFHPHSSKDVWTNIDTDPSAVYSKNWEESCPSQLFNFKDVAGQDNLMHVVAQQNSPGGVYVATFDSSSSMMKIGPAWLLDQSKYGTNKAVFYTPGSIHSLGLNGSQAILTSIPVTSSSITPPVGSATIRNVSATIGAKCPEALSRFRAHTLGNNGIISCMNWVCRRWCSGVYAGCTRNHFNN
ncbi:MAG: hypothetical protein JOS17DRAFT_736625 [Linnemannia elongata]|nr:MAG: hypothetical protein JOS17DRAFT_736625 [Linnemannia elongata]